jgi:hypothetical protein
MVGMDLAIRRIEHHAVVLRNEPTDGFSTELDDPAPTVDLPFERPLFKPPYKPHIDDQVVTNGDEDVPADALFDQVHVDKAELRLRIRAMLRTRAQVSLADIVAAHPLEHGVGELVAYMSIASDDPKALIDDERKQTFRWQDPARGTRQALLPLVVFTR